MPIADEGRKLSEAREAWRQSPEPMFIMTPVRAYSGAIVELV